MDTKKFQRATIIMSELKWLHESLEYLKNSCEMAFSSRREVRFGKNSQTFAACKDIAISEYEKRIAQLEKEFNDL